MTDVEITDEMVDAFLDGQRQWERDHGEPGSWGAGRGYFRAGLGAVAPLIAEQVRADERRTVAEEFEGVLHGLVGGYRDQAAVTWNPQTKRDLLTRTAAYEQATALARDLRVPYCGHELHSADGGACPRCGHDPYAPVKVAVAEAEQVWTGEEHRYLSTGCLHGDHGYCAAMVGVQGVKRGGTCKFCEARCVCACHETEEA